MSKKPILRGKTEEAKSIHPLNQIPKDVIVKFFAHIVYLISVGKDDLTGDDVSIAFAKAIKGEFRKTPNGLVDVFKDKYAWSIKTIKVDNISQTKRVRLISGRNNVLYSYPDDYNLRNIKKTGQQVIEIWNERVNQVRSEYNDFRTLIVIRSDDLKDFIIFEEDTLRYEANNYSWERNSKRNFIATNKTTGKIVFTWQPNGAQFTIHKEVPINASKYVLQKPDILNEEKHLKDIGYNKDWVHFIIEEE